MGGRGGRGARERVNRFVLFKLGRDMVDRSYGGGWSVRWFSMVVTKFSSHYSKWNFSNHGEGDTMILRRKETGEILTVRLQCWISMMVIY